VPTSWHDVYSLIATCELRRLTCTWQAFGLVHIVQKLLTEAEEIDWYNFNDRNAFMTAIEKKSKLKN